jgi:hypothetical protein
MASQRQDQQVGIAPAPSYQPQNFAIDRAMESIGWQQAADAFQSGFDIIKRDFDQQAVDQARLDAPGIVQRDGKGVLLPVASFEPKGLKPRAYRSTYEQTARAYYLQTAESDFSQHAASVQSLHPTDVDAANAKLEEKKNAMLMGADPTFQPLMALRLNAIQGQTISRINGANQAEINKATEERGQYAYQRFVIDAANVAQLPDRFDPETIKLNGAQLAQKWTETETLLKQAGWSDARINKALSDARAKVFIAREESYVRAWASKIRETEASGVSVDPKNIAEALQYIEGKAKEAGPDGPAVRQALEAAFQQGHRIAQAKVAASDYQQTRETQQAALQAKQALDSADPFAIAPIMQSLRSDRAKVYNDINLTESQKLQRLAMYDQVLGEGMKNTADFAANRVTFLSNAATNPETPPDRAKGAVHELRQIAEDPTISNYIPVGVRNYAERTIAHIATNRLKGDFNLVSGLASTGGIAPSELASWIDGHVSRGTIGDGPNALMSHAEGKMLLQNGTQAYGARQYENSAARSAYNNWAGSGMQPAGEGATALQKKVPFTTSDGQAFNPSSPVHVQDAAAYFHHLGVLPKNVREAMQNVPMGTDPQTTQNIAGLAKSIESTFKAKGYSSDAAIAQTNNLLGGTISSYLRNVRTFGPDVAADFAKSEPNADTRNLGSNPENKMASLGGALDRALGKLTGVGPDAAEPGLINRLWSPSRETDWTRQILRGDQPTFMSELWNGLSPISGRKQSGTWDVVGIDPAVRSKVLGAAYQIARTDGVAIHQANKQGDPEQIIAMQALLSVRDHLEIVADPSDPKKGVLSWKTANTRIGEMLGTGRVDDDSVRGFALGLVRQSAALRRELTGMDEITAPYDPKTVSMGSYFDANGSLRWMIVAQEKAGLGTIVLEDMSNADPRLSAHAGDLVKQTSVEMRKNWFGIDGSKDPNKVDASFLGGSMVGRLLSSVIGGGKSLLTDSIRSSNLTTRLTDENYDPTQGHYTKALMDAIFETDGSFSREKRAWLNLNPYWLIDGTLPGSTADWEGMRRSLMEKGNLELERFARDHEFAKRIQNGLNVETRSLK